MAKYSSYTNNNHPDIVFENVSTRTVKVGLPVARSAYLFDENNQITFALPVINAIDIDWNGADLSSASSSFANAADTAPVSTITTAGELTKEFYSPMFAKAA